jgi:hypothetical protein
MDWAIQWFGGKIEERPIVRRTSPVARKASNKDFTDLALRTWAECTDIAGSLAEAYLRHRCAWPETVNDLRFHPNCPMGKDRQDQLIRAPAMVGLMRNIITGKPQGIHRTALLRDGTGRDKVLGKKMLGPQEGAAIMLCPPEDVTTGLGISEGIENGTTMMASGWRPVWCALSAGGVEAFPVIDGVERLTIFADADDRGRGQEAARNCASRWYREGRGVDILTPPAGKDWNRVAQERAA